MVSTARRTILGLLLLSFIAGDALAQNPPGLRILTYNTALLEARFYVPPLPPLPPEAITLDFNAEQFGLDIETRAHRIADAILAAKDDIVVLEEVFSDDAREILVDRLKTRFPSYIEKVSGEAQVEIFGVATPDSGLMLFSRYPFLNLSAQASPPRELGVVGSNQGSLWGWLPLHTASVRFDCAYLDADILGLIDKLPTSDCLASKGAALVRIDAPYFDVSVVMTHMQASYSLSDGVEKGIRDGQLKDVRRLIEQSLTSQQLRSQNESILFVGDLNVRGSNHPPPGVAEPEWEQQFHGLDNASEGFFARGDGPTLYPGLPGWQRSSRIQLLSDAWGFGTAPEDPGITNADDQARLDYIFYKEARAVCIQHLTLAHDLHGWGESPPLSDHLGVRADINWPHDYCSPRIAGPVSTQRFRGNHRMRYGPWSKAGIHRNGSMQWFRIDEAGAYSISTDSPQVGFLVYKADDLSRPAPSYHQEVTDWGDYYALYDPPYYVRTFGVKAGTAEPDPTFTGEYIITFYKHQCTHKGDFCALEAGVPVPFVWPDTGVTPDQKFWFKFYSDTSDLGEYPDVSFALETWPPWNKDDLTLTLVRDDPASTEIPFADVEAKGGSAPSGSQQQWELYHAPNDTLAGSDDGSPRAYYLVAERKPQLAHVPIEQHLTFATNLTYLRPVALECLVCDQPPDDNLRIGIQPDLIVAVAPCQPGCTGKLKVGEGGQTPLNHQVLRRKFLTQAKPWLLWTGTALDSGWGDGTIAPLDPWNHGVEDSGIGWWDGFRWRDGPNGDEADYWYSMQYLLAHEAYYVDD